MTGMFYLKTVSIILYIYQLLFDPNTKLDRLAFWKTFEKLNRDFCAIFYIIMYIRSYVNYLSSELHHASFYFICIIPQHDDTFGRVNEQQLYNFIIAWLIKQQLRNFIAV